MRIITSREIKNMLLSNFQFFSKVTRSLYSQIMKMEKIVNMQHLSSYVFS